MCVSRKPWLLALEFMRNKDLATLLRQCKPAGFKFRMHEMLTFPAQVADAFVYLTSVRAALQPCLRAFSHHTEEDCAP